MRDTPRPSAKSAPGRRKVPKNPPRRSHDFMALPLAPLVFRSGRPFGGVGEATTSAGLAWPLPGNVAATVRNHLCASVGYVPSPRDDFIHGLWVQGPIRCSWQEPSQAAAPKADLTLWLPTPANARQRVRAGRATSPVRLLPKPWGDGCGADLPHGLLPLQPHDGEWADMEPPPPADWRLADVVNWLTHQAAMPAAQDTAPPVAQGKRVHIALDEAHQVKTGHFFVNELLDFGSPLAARTHAQQGLWMRISAPDPLPDTAPDLVRALQTLGDGAWRLGADGAATAWRPVNSSNGLQSLTLLSHTLAAKERAGLVGATLALYLATPACFGRNGWYPDGLRPDPGDSAGRLVGRPVGFPDGWEFELVGAAVPGWQAQGSLKNPTFANTRGAEGRGATRMGTLTRLVPAGSMYWLKVRKQGGAVDWPSLLLAPCCRVDHGRDGHGLALYAPSPTL